MFAGAPVHGSNGPVQIQIEDLQSGQILTLPGSDNIFSPRWSPDGRLIAALTAGSFELVVYQFATERWRRSLATPAGSLGRRGRGTPRRSGTARTDDCPHSGVADGQMTPVVTLKGMRQVILPGGESWIGVAPDYAPMVLREVTSPPEIYALEVDWP